jgi:hypothetical protein|tara:strand:- start:1281 stop:1847 length:567 start_codon:yes stop_codon:yes gene_type:complete
MALKPKCIKDKKMGISPRQKTIKTIILNVNEELNIDLMANNTSRVQVYVFARSIVYELLRKHLRMTLIDISKVFNNNHATVIHGLKQLPYTIKYDSEAKHSYNNIVFKWLGNVENFVPVNDSEVKKRITQLINENKNLTLEVEALNKSLKHYTGKYEKFYKLVADADHRLGDKFSVFERKVNTFLNGL